MKNIELIYTLLKRIEIDKPVSQEETGLEGMAYEEIMEELVDGRLVENVSFSRSGSGVLTVRTSGVKLTRRGHDFILLKETGRI